MGESVLSEMKTDALGEIYNIAMGSAAVAVSGMIDSTVSITAPQVNICKASDIAKTKLKQIVKGILFNKDEDTVYVKVDYSGGINGTSLMIFNAGDMEMIFHRLMGMPMELDDEFEFDEMGISAISEVMNQMLGSASTSLSQFLNATIEISPPETVVSADTKTLYKMQGTAASAQVCAIAFDFKVDEAIDSKFITILSVDMANDMAGKLVGSSDEDEEEYEDDDEEALDGILSVEKKDALGEIQNIMMGSAATALSNFMNAKVWITTPKVMINKAGHISFDDLDPSICVKINYIKGIHGSSFLVLKQGDVQMMVNQLMGLPPVITDDFEFDEMNVSAVCEIMNQMMGASATTLSEIISTPTDISTPEAVVIDLIDDILKINNIDEKDNVCAISFDLNIDGIMNSHFVTMLSIDLANEMAEKMLSEYSGVQKDTPDAKPEKAQKKSQPEKKAVSNTAEPVANDKPKAAAPKQSVQKPQSQGRIVSGGSASEKRMKVEEYHIDSLEDDELSNLSEKQYNNLRSLMDVPMEVKVRIGSTEKSIEEVGNFTRGTIIELDTVANEPVDILVNGNLIARGDVVVVDDNFAVRITEIVK